MAKFQLNTLVQSKQRRAISIFVIVLVVVFASMVVILSDGKKHHAKKKDLSVDLTGIVDESFSEANAESALTAQQSELDSLKTQIKALKVTVSSLHKNAQKAANSEKEADVSKLIAEKIAAMGTNSKPNQTPPVVLANNTSNATMNDAPKSWQENSIASGQVGANYAPHSFSPHKPLKIHSVSFRYNHKSHKTKHRLNPDNYVPSGTFVRAVVLGGADADASVNGQSKNNGVMLFKLLQPGTLPNGAHSHLQGCFVTASSYGDISSERAYVILDKLSCVLPDRPIIDKVVTGWAFFGGKVGIKGQPLMRDNKVMQWAGISGALSGVASAAQYAQSVQSFGALGAASIVPSPNIGPYAAYGGASKAADVLSNYYVKRAEQYHPVIQVGSGNLVTIVFKDGFYLEPDVDKNRNNHQKPTLVREEITPSDDYSSEGNSNFSVPPEVLDHIDRSRVEGGMQ